MTFSLEPFLLPNSLLLLQASLGAHGHSSSESKTKKKRSRCTQPSWFFLRICPPELAASARSPQPISNSVTLKPFSSGHPTTYLRSLDHKLAPSLNPISLQRQALRFTSPGVFCRSVLRPQLKLLRPSWGLPRQCPKTHLVSRSRVTPEVARKARAG